MKYILLIIIFFGSLILPRAQQTATLQTGKVISGDGNSGAAIVGPYNSPVTINLVKNPNNNTSGTFTTYAPAVSATFTLSNLMYQDVITDAAGSFPVITMGRTHTLTGGGGPLPVFGNLSSLKITNYVPNSVYSSSASKLYSGISHQNNNGVGINLNSWSLDDGTHANTGRHYMADLIITFNKEVDYPVLQLSDLGQAHSGFGIATEFDVFEIKKGVETPVTLDLLSTKSTYGWNNLPVGDAIQINGNQINNFVAQQAFPHYLMYLEDHGMGSVLVNGKGIKEIKLKLFLHGVLGIGTYGENEWHVSSNSRSTLDDFFRVGLSLSNDLEINTVINTTTPEVNEEIEFTVTAKNNGSLDDNNVKVDLPLSGYTYVSSTATQGSFNSTTGVWTIGDFADGEQAVLKVKAKVTSPGVQATVSKIYGDFDDYDLSNNTSAVTRTSCLETIFSEDFGTSNLAVNSGRITSPYMPANSFTFATPYPATNEYNKYAINDNHYAVVAPGHIKAGVGSGYYFWTPAYNEAGAVKDMSGTQSGAAMVVNGGTTLTPFYRRNVSLEYDTYYNTSLSIYVKNQPARVGIKVYDAITHKVYGVLFSDEFATDNSGWKNVQLSFYVPKDADVNCDMQNVYIEFFNALSLNIGNDYFIDNIQLEKLYITGSSCLPPSNFTSLVCPSVECTNDPNTATGSGSSRIGITTHTKNPQWPEGIPNGFIALESASKGFVITRVNSSDNISDPKEGMLIYDKTATPAPCVKLYREGVWNCIQQYCYSGDKFTLLCNSFAAITGELHANYWGSMSGMLPYANGDNSSFTTTNIPSQGVTGLTASITLPQGNTILQGAGGYFNVSIYGIASGAGIATFPIKINGSECSIQIKVLP